MATAAGVLGAAFLAALSPAAFPSDPLIPVVVVGTILVLGLAVVRPMAVVAAGVLVIPLEGFIGGSPIGPSQALLGAAAIGWLIGWVATRPRTLPSHPALAAFGLLVVATAAGLIFAPEPLIVGRQVATWGVLFVVAAAIAKTQGGPEVRTLLLAFAACGGLAGMIAVLGVEPSTVAFGGYVDPDRAEAGLGSPNALGVLLAMALPVQLMFVFRGTSVVRALALACVAFSLVGMTLAVSRGSFIGLAAAIVVLVLWAPFRRWALALVPILLLFLLAGSNPVASILDQEIVDRLAEIKGSGGNNPRLVLWEAAPKMVEDHPAFGVGALEFGYHAGEYGIGASPAAPNHAHSTPLTIAAELGLVGLAAFVALAFFVGVGLQRAIRFASEDAQAMGYALAASFTVLLVSGMLDYVLGAPPMAAAAFVLVGCAVSLALGVERSAVEERGAGLAPSLEPGTA
ncbi:MAG: O-antigen ligase family protein [Deltaproteobacteria bacterium]|nr:O-antigen ligase family protein [Deltaproteobacteria bacterium]